MANSKLRLIALYDSTGADLSDQFSSFAIVTAEPDSSAVTFAAARNGGGDDWSMTATISQDHTTGSVWDQCWTNPGDEWTGYYAPGTSSVTDLADASATTPIFEFTATISRPRGTILGGDANTSLSAIATTDIEWQLTGQPTKHTTAITP